MWYQKQRETTHKIHSLNNFVTRKESPNIRRADDREGWKATIAYVCNRPEDDDVSNGQMGRGQRCFDVETAVVDLINLFIEVHLKYRYQQAKGIGTYKNKVIVGNLIHPVINAHFFFLIFSRAILNGPCLPGESYFYCDCYQQMHISALLG